ncbi:MAG TPA: NAD-dependent epimerase/dehydratase family protein, partial [Verrucomicrobiae bacterium]|nr:NAD-dependent epimerase/dehydratase family protein [Verrucomicrobiae bacterium]
GRWNYYMRTKIEAEQIVLQEFRHKDLKTTVIRPAIMYGTGDQHVLAGVIDSLRRGKIAFMGDPDVPLPLVDVRDVARGAILAACSEKAIGEAFNMVSPETVSQREYFDTVASLIGLPPVRKRLPYRLAYGVGFAVEALGHLFHSKNVPLTRHRVSLFGHRRIYSIDKSRRLLGWEPTIRFQDGIREAVAGQLKDEQRPPVSASLRAQTTTPLAGRTDSPSPQTPPTPNRAPRPAAK